MSDTPQHLSHSDIPIGSVVLYGERRATITGVSFRSEGPVLLTSGGEEVPPSECLIAHDASVYFEYGGNFTEVFQAKGVPEGFPLERFLEIFAMGGSFRWEGEILQGKDHFLVPGGKLTPLVKFNVASDAHVKLWNAINDFASTIPALSARMDAVVQVEAALRAFVMDQIARHDSNPDRSYCPLYKPVKFSFSEI